MISAYRVSTDAYRDLDAIWLYGARTFSVEKADDYDRRIHDAFDRIALHPLAAPAVPGRTDGVRMLVEGSHIIFYRPEPTPPLIVRVMHQRQDWTSLMGSEPG